MKAFIEKLISRLEDEKKIANNTFMNYEMNVDLGRVYGLERAVEIINQLAEEYKPTIDVAELVEKFGQEHPPAEPNWQEHMMNRFMREN